MRKLTKKELSEEVELQITNTGFTIWLKDNIKTKDNIDYPIRHWVVDASNFFNTGIINLVQKKI